MVDPTRLSTYYELIKDLTIPSRKVEVGEKFTKEIIEAYALLLEAEDVTPKHASVLARNILEQHPELERAILEEIELYGAVFVRGDGASPKDACTEYSLFYPDQLIRLGVFPLPQTMNNACLYTKPIGAVTMLVLSERAHVIGKTDIIWIRRPAVLRDEMRIFIHKGKIRLASWYYPDHPPRDPETLKYLLKNHYAPLTREVLERTKLDNIVIDVGLGDRKPIVVELTPFPPEDNNKRLIGGTDTILFRKDFWEQLEKAEQHDTVIIRTTTMTTRTRTIKTTLEH